MSVLRRPAFVAVLTLAVPAAALACMWDHDTLLQERSRFPSALELITGKFLRHSPEFYEWRITDRLARLQSDPENPRLYDDLGVAYDKTGQHDKAIAMMLELEKKQPGRYETYANLGTFYLHAGQFEKGLPMIDKALAINPDAHFGRERYQKWLAEYVQARRKDGKVVLPLSSLPQSAEGERQPANFAEFVQERVGKTPANTGRLLAPEERQAAIKGMLGIMRFGSYDSPIVLEALADLLYRPGYDIMADAKQLAARAYLKASYEVKDPSARDAYRELAKQALAMQREAGEANQSLSLERLESDFKAELEDARSWYADLREKELSWVRGGGDPEAEFDRLYAEEPQVPVVGEEAERGGSPSGAWRWVRQNPLMAVSVALPVVLLLALAGAAIRQRRRGG